MAKVSIIIPIYNVEEYLPRTVGSVTSQTEQDIEIILVDDGSTDGSGSICDGFAAKDSRVTVIHKPNGGLSSARNAGTERASSEYVLFLDGDDYLRTDAIERLLSVAEIYPSDYIQFHYREVFDDAEAPDDAPMTAELYHATTPRQLFENLYKLGGVAASGCTKLFRRSLVEAVPFEDIRHEDEMWCTRAFEYADTHPLTVTYIPDMLYYYVMRDNSIIRGSFSRKKLDIFKIADERIQTLTRLGFDDLLHHEYERIFGSVVGLYCAAKCADDRNALRLIKQNFTDNKANIKKHAHLSRKFALLFKAMCLSYPTVHLYYLFKKYRNKS